MYLIKTYEAGSTIEVYKTYSKRYGRKIPRGAKKGRTPPDVMKVNDRNAEAELRRVLNANFRPKDYHLVLTYEGEQPPSQEEAKAALERFIRKCRAEYKREGLEFKYVAVTEYLHTRIHHHIVVPRAELSRIVALWGGIVRVSVLDNSGQYGALAAYLIKETTKTMRVPGSLHKRRWTGSRNLIHPQPKVEVVKAKAWREEPKAIKGYILDRDSVRNGVSAVTGMPMQFYRLIAIAAQERQGQTSRKQPGASAPVYKKTRERATPSTPPLVNK